MMRMISGVRLRYRKSSIELSMAGLCEDVVVVVRKLRLR